MARQASGVFKTEQSNASEEEEKRKQQLISTETEANASRKAANIMISPKVSVINSFYKPV